MVSLVRKCKLSGMLPQDDLIHIAVMVESAEIAPIYVQVPGGRKVPQYAPTVIGKSLAYDPAGDCDVAGSEDSMMLINGPVRCDG